MLRDLRNSRFVVVTVTARLRNEQDRFYGGRRRKASKFELERARELWIIAVYDSKNSKSVLEI
jgi:hypothetical protein